MVAADLLLKTGAFVVFATLMSGLTYGAYQAIPTAELTPRGLVLDPIEGALAVAPGQTVSLGFMLRNGGAEAELVRVAAAEAGGFAGSEPVDVRVPAGGSAGAWVLLDVPATLKAGAHRATLLATIGERTITSSVVLNVVTSGPALAEGQGAAVHYVGRLASGEMFNTNWPTYLQAPVPRAAFYRPSGEFTVQTGESANVIAGLWQGMVGMRVGETRTIVIAPEDAYGPKLLEEKADRRTTVEREFTVPVRPLTRPAAAFAEHIRATGQGDPADFGVNDTFRETQAGNDWRFRITAVTPDTVTYVPAPALGEAFTLPQHAAWRNASVVERVSDSSITFVTTPTTPVGEPFTFFEYWPGASEVERMNETHVVVRHTPPVGLAFLAGGGQQGPQAFQVKSVEEDTITLLYESDHPLAGETLVFDVRVLRVTTG